MWWYATAAPEDVDYHLLQPLPGPSILISRVLIRPPNCINDRSSVFR